MQGCHGNGNPADCRLENLRWDTPKNNHADRKKHGTSSEGSRNPAAKLTEADVVMIRTLLAEGLRQTDIANRFGVGKGVINHISAGRSWVHVS
jgi:hypothetical protein